LLGQTFAEAKALTSAPPKALHSSKFVPGSSRSKNQEEEIQQDAVDLLDKPAANVSLALPRNDGARMKNGNAGVSST
jgi:hypothetical protein